MWASCAGLYVHNKAGVEAILHNVKRSNLKRQKRDDSESEELERYRWLQYTDNWNRGKVCYDRRALVQAMERMVRDIQEY